MKRNKRIRLLIIGPCQMLGHALGGATVAFEEMLSGLESCCELRLACVSTTRPKQGRLARLCSSMRTLARLIVEIPQAQVVALFGSNTSLPATVPLVQTLCVCLGGKPLIVRKFGGLPHDAHIEGHFISGAALTKLNGALKRCSIYLPQTRKAQKAGFDIGATTGWMPNYRSLPVVEDLKKSKQCKRFVYIGQVRPEKGLEYLIQAASVIRSDCVIDIYGPLMGGIAETDFAIAKQINYRGVLSPYDVHPTLLKYDAYVFPSTFTSEGHPGSLIEALACGLPIITTNVGAIGEVVTEKEGILVDPGSFDQLALAINRLHDDSEMFQEMRDAAIERSELFDSAIWTDNFATLCKALANKEKLPNFFFE